MGSHNRWLWGAMLVSLLCTTLVIEVPFLANAFQFEHISIQEYLIAMSLAIVIIPIMEVTKFIQRRIDAGKKQA